MPIFEAWPQLGPILSIQALCICKRLGPEHRYTYLLMLQYSCIMPSFMCCWSLFLLIICRLHKCRIKILFLWLPTWLSWFCQFLFFHYFALSTLFWNKYLHFCSRKWIIFFKPSITLTISLSFPPIYLIFWKI